MKRTVIERAKHFDKSEDIGKARGESMTATLKKMQSIVNGILDKKRIIIKDCIKDKRMIPRYDLRDFTDRGLIYGMRKSRVRFDPFPDFDHFNLGRCLTYEVNIPDYRFFHFKDIYEEIRGIYREVGWLEAIYKMPVESVLGQVFNVLSNNDKYFRTICGRETGYRICIFLYGGPYTDDLDDLAQQFHERDKAEAKAVSSYFNSRLMQACDRLNI